MTGAERGDLAERMIPLAAELAAAVTAEDAAAVEAALAATGWDVQALAGLAVVLAAGYQPPKTCRNCGEERRRRASRKGYVGGRDLCGTCYSRARLAGFPEDVPPPMPARERQAASVAARIEDAADRRERFAVLRGRGWTVAEAGGELWVSQRTAERYEAWYQAQREAVAA